MQEAPYIKGDEMRKPATRMQKAKRYISENYPQLIIAVGVGMWIAIGIDAAKNRKRDLLSLSHKTGARLTQGLVDGVPTAGAEYTIRGNKFWLLPALVELPEEAYIDL